MAPINGNHFETLRQTMFQHEMLLWQLVDNESMFNSNIANIKYLFDENQRNDVNHSIKPTKLIRLLNQIDMAIVEYDTRLWEILEQRSELKLLMLDLNEFQNSLLPKENSMSSVYDSTVAHAEQPICNPLEAPITIKKDFVAKRKSTKKTLPSVDPKRMDFKTIKRLIDISSIPKFDYKEHGTVKNPNSFKCETCGKIFKDKPYFKAHCQSHITGHLFECYVCHARQLTESLLKKHMRIHTAEFQYECELCHIKFQFPHKLKLHMQFHTTSFECYLCKKMVKDKYTMIKHMRAHTGEQPYTCVLCGKRFMYSSDYYYHKKMHNASGSFQCSICAKQYTHKRSLQMHEKTHVIASESMQMKIDKQPTVPIIKKKYVKRKVIQKCEYCQKIFKDKDHFKIHVLTHTAEKTIECNLCDRKFCAPILLKKHMKKHLTDDNETEQSLCSQCGESFNTKAKLSTHLKTHWTDDEKPYACDVCHQRFTYKATLMLHIVKHNDSKSTQINYDRMHQCHLCDAKFVYQSKLKMHMNRHSGIKPYACDQCDNRFATAQTLKIHKQWKHSDDRPFQCEFCTNAFKRKDALVAHIRTHTGEKPFVCEVCDRAFSENKSMKKHRMTHFK